MKLQLETLEKLILFISELEPDRNIFAELSHYQLSEMITFVDLGWVETGNIILEAFGEGSDLMACPIESRTLTGFVRPRSSDREAELQYFLSKTLPSTSVHDFPFPEVIPNPLDPAIEAGLLGISLKEPQDSTLEEKVMLVAQFNRQTRAVRRYLHTGRAKYAGKVAHGELGQPYKLRQIQSKQTGQRS